MNDRDSVKKRHQEPLTPPEGRCEAVDWVPTEDDAEARRCPNRGVRVIETLEMLGRQRMRVVCAYHRSLIEEKMS